MKKLGDRAIVAGAGMAGLLATRVLTDHYHQVVLLEKDAFPLSGENRKGVPQGRHTHALLLRGRELLEDLFPGLREDLVERGALVYDNLAHVRRFIGGGYYWRGHSGLTSLMVSRPHLEAYVRARVLELPNVSALEQCDVLGLLATSDQTRITGVRVAQRDRAKFEEVGSGDLVVDATGRGSRIAKWLESLGYTPPEEERVEIRVAYATRHYHRVPGQFGGDLGALVTPLPGHRRLGIAIAQEGMRWIVTLCGYDDPPPTDHAGFLEFARTLSAPDIYELIRDAEPIDDAVPARFPANLRRHFERLTRFPEGLIVVGDAVCSFNPIYGQGMSVAAIESIALRDALQGGTAGLASRFFKTATTALDSVWGITVGGDRRIISPNQTGSAGSRFLGWYLGRLHLTARRDPVAARAFIRVTGLLDAPAKLLRPSVATRVLLAQLRSRAALQRRPTSLTPDQKAEREPVYHGSTDQEFEQK